MAELLKVRLRGETCRAAKDITDGAGQEMGNLVCGLQPDHPGPLHYDDADRIWWCADA